jgi:hypothetical protein
MLGKKRPARTEGALLPCKGVSLRNRLHELLKRLESKPSQTESFFRTEGALLPCKGVSLRILDEHTKLGKKNDQ